MGKENSLHPHLHFGMVTSKHGSSYYDAAIKTYLLLTSHHCTVVLTGSNRGGQSTYVVNHNRIVAILPQCFTLRINK